MGSRRSPSMVAAFAAAVICALASPASASTTMPQLGVGPYSGKEGSATGTPVSGLIAVGSVLSTAGAGIVYLMQRRRRVDPDEMP